MLSVYSQLAANSDVKNGKCPIVPSPKKRKYKNVIKIS